MAFTTRLRIFVRFHHSRFHVRSCARSLSPTLSYASSLHLPTSCSSVRPIHFVLCSCSSSAPSALLHFRVEAFLVCCVLFSFFLPFHLCVLSLCIFPIASALCAPHYISANFTYVYIYARWALKRLFGTSWSQWMGQTNFDVAQWILDLEMTHSTHSNKSYGDTEVHRTYFVSSLFHKKNCIIFLSGDTKCARQDRTCECARLQWAMKIIKPFTCTCTCPRKASI